MNRKMTEDQWNTIIAIKQGYFESFWKERCGNEDYPSTPNKLSILSSLATEVFDKAEWDHFREAMLRRMDYSITKKRGVIFKKKKSLTLKQLLSCYVSAFVCMRMVFPDKDMT